MDARRLAAVLALVLVAPAALLVTSDEAEAATVTRTLAINTASARPTVPFAAFDGNPPKVYDIDGDGDLEIIAQNDNQWVYVFDSRTGALLAELKTVFPPGWGARSFNGPEVSILERNGTVRLILANSAATITSYTYDSVGSTSLKLGFRKDWDRRLTDCHPSPGMDSKPVLADLDRDGVFEILAATEEYGLFALRADGSVYWGACIGGGNAEPAVTDLNLDGWPDVVFGSDGGVVTALNGRTGGTMWSFSVLSRFNLGSGSMPVGVGIGQLDGVGGPDIVGGARDSHNATDFSQDHALLFALDSSGRLLWGKQDPAGNPLTYTHPIVADVAGDGANEVYWGDWNTIGHKPPANEADSWKVTGPANYYRYSNTGELVWKQTLGTFWSNKDVALADADGDGDQEMLANGPRSDGHDGIHLLDAGTGAKQGFIDLYPWKAQRGPVVADLHGDGMMDLIVEAGPQASGAGSGGAILVYDLGVPYSAAWPHLPYAELGPIGPPAPPPPPAAGTFGATFRITSPNAYWQQVRVTPDLATPLAKVEMRRNEGPWTSMALQSYGDWTASVHTPAGTKVEFLATAQSGAIAQSQPFTWLDGTLTQRSVPQSTSEPTSTGTGTSTSTGTSSSSSTTASTPTSTSTTTTTSSATGTTSSSTSPSATTSTSSTFTSSTSTSSSSSTSTSSSSATTSTTSTSTSSTSTTTAPAPPAFNATFRVPSGVNEWWVEVAVTANEPVAGVDARVNGGSWTPLTKQSWGSWAKSFFVARGATVEFRATSSDGDQKLSAPVQWLGAPPPPPPPGPFTAAFTPKAVGNDWWIEADVSANEPLGTVEVALNGGAWTPLAKQSWGSWAKSLNASNGTQVTFRATSADGDQAVSSAVTWT